MRVVIAGAGNVGRSIAPELLANGHRVLLIDRDPGAIRADVLPEAEWLLADCCELSTLTEAALDRADVSIAATGDDKANLVFSLLARTEFGVPRTVARVNHPGNEWMFDEVWGVDVAVSMPRLMSALVEEAVTVGDLVRLFSFRGSTNLVELTLPDESPWAARPVADLALPGDAVLVAAIRDGAAHAAGPDLVLRPGDELLIVVSSTHEEQLRDHLVGAQRPPAGPSTLREGGSSS